MAVHDNAPARLHRLLTELEAKSGDRPFLGNLAAVLEVEEGETEVLLEAFAAVQALPRQAEQAIRALPDVNHEMLLRWRAPVTKFMVTSLQMRSPAKSANATVSQTDLYALELAGDLVARAKPANEPPEDELAEARRLVDQLLQELEDSSLDDEVRAFLIRQVASIALALRLVKITGLDGIRDAMARAVGALVTTQSSRSIEDQGLVNRFMTVIGHLANLVTVGVGLAQLAPGVQMLIDQIASSG